MDGLALACATSKPPRNPLFPPLVRIQTITTSGTRQLPFLRRKRFVVLAAKGGEEEEEEDDSRMKLDEWDQMELKFGRFLGEDPNLTLAKIMARKANPDASFAEVEKSFYKNRGKVVKIEELPFDVPGRPKKTASSADGLNLVRPVPKKGVKFETGDKPMLPPQKISRPDKPVTASTNSKRSVPKVILRKPSLYVEADVEDRPMVSSSKVRIRPNLTLKMGSDQSKEAFSDMTLLRKPEPVSVDKKEEVAIGGGQGNAGADVVGLTTGKENYSGFTLLKKPEKRLSSMEESVESLAVSVAKEEEEEELEEVKMGDNSTSGMQPIGKSMIGLIERETPITRPSDKASDDSVVTISVETAMHARPKRLDLSVEETSTSSVKDSVFPSAGSYETVNDLEDLYSTTPLENADWSRAENLLQTGFREEVELISSSAKGFVVSFGSLIGFLPYRNLAAKWKFLAFESWLRQKGLDPLLYRQNLGIIGSYDALDKNPPSDLSNGTVIDREILGEITADMKLEDLLRIYDQEKLKFLSSFVGQRIKVNVVMADRKSRKLIVSLRPKEKDELIERKRNLMAKLQIGDIVRCCIKKITYFGIFVEVDGVPALIHQTEVSWDATLDPSSSFKVGQIVEAKVHQLDFALERIFLSLKETTPDPLTEALECVIGDRDPLGGRLQAAEADAEWADVESLIRELQQIEGVHTVSKGRFFLSPGLAPTFQVYMASMYEDQYKLLARSGNKVQELIVQASLSKEEMKATILSCANRVE